MKLKTIEVAGATYAAVQDGKPVFVHDDGKEIAFDAVGTVARIGALNGEAKGHRERAEAAEAKLKGFEGIEDAEAARKALATVKTLADGDLVKAGEVDRIKAEAIKAVEDKFKPVTAERDRLAQQLHHEIVGGSFLRSKFIADKVAIPAEFVQARFGEAFKVEGGRLVAYADGAKLFSRSNPGELAGFDEAIELLIERHPQRDSILKGSGANGGGATGGGNGGGAGKSLPRAAFEALGPGERMAHIKGGGKITD